MASISNVDWMRVAKDFSDADLRAHPITADVMANFSDDAEFQEIDGRVASKTVAWVAFKVMCEWGVLDFLKVREPNFEEKEDHILWSFKSIQCRKSVWPTWIKPAQWYTIDCTARLYFSGVGASTKISRLVMTQKKWDLMLNPND